MTGYLGKSLALTSGMARAALAGCAVIALHSNELDAPVQPWKPSAATLCVPLSMSPKARSSQFVDGDDGDSAA